MPDHHDGGTGSHAVDIDIIGAYCGVQLMDIAGNRKFGSTLVAAAGTTLNTSTSGITITCQ